MAARKGLALLTVTVASAAALVSRVFVSDLDAELALSARTCRHNRIANPPLSGYPDTYYSRTSEEKPLQCAPLSADASVSADVCVIGGGYAGLHTALSLRERGKTVTLLEADQVGYHASGRNGGMVMAGYATDITDIEDEVGDAKVASQMYDDSVQGVKTVERRISQYAIRCDKKHNGYLLVSPFADRLEEYAELSQHLNGLLRTADPDSLSRPEGRFRVVPREELRRMIKSVGHYFGLYYPHGFSVNPLALSIGLGRALIEQGGKLFEHTCASGVSEAHESASHGRKFEVSTTTGGKVNADHVVFCSNVAHPGASKPFFPLASVPVHTYVCVTEPLTEEQRANFPEDLLVCDDVFALNYYRLLNDGRLLWGGLCQTYSLDLNDAGDILQGKITEFFPQLEGTKLDSVWGGTMGFARHHMPMIGRLQAKRLLPMASTNTTGLWYAHGFAGHGLNTTAMAGNILADAIVDGDTSKVENFERNYPLCYSGWPFGPLGAQLSYNWFQLRDWWDLRRRT